MVANAAAGRERKMTTRELKECIRETSAIRDTKLFRDFAAFAEIRDEERAFHAHLAGEERVSALPPTRKPKPDGGGDGGGDGAHVPSTSDPVALMMDAAARKSGRERKGVWSEPGKPYACGRYVVRAPRAAPAPGDGAAAGGEVEAAAKEERDGAPHDVVRDIRSTFPRRTLHPDDAERVEADESEKAEEERAATEERRKEEAREGTEGLQPLQDLLKDRNNPDAAANAAVVAGEEPPPPILRVGQKFSHCAFLKASRARIAAAKAGHAPPRAKDSAKKETQDGDAFETITRAVHAAHQWQRNARKAAESRASRAAATVRTKRRERDPTKKVDAWRSEFAAQEKSGVDRLEALLRPPEEER